MNKVQNTNEKPTQEKQLTKQFTKMLCGDEAKASAFIAQLITTLKNSPKIAAILNDSEQEKNAFFSRMITVATAGLSPEPGAGHIAMIPFKDKIQIITMVGGWCKIAKDNNTSILSQIVYENDEFEIFPADPRIHHKIKLDVNGHRGKVIGYYAQATDLKYRKVVAVEFMSVVQVRKHAEAFKLTKSESSPWNTHFDAMGKKTVVRQVVKNIGSDLTAGIHKLDIGEEEECKVFVDAVDVPPKDEILSTNNSIVNSQQIGKDDYIPEADINFPS